jgi:hypothetical protein
METRDRIFLGIVLFVWLAGMALIYVVNGW